MGLTLVSIAKITAAGYKVIFRGTTCKIFDQKDKVIGLIMVKNGLYRVDHEILVNMAMTGEAREVLTLEELHGPGIPGRVSGQAEGTTRGESKAAIF